MSALPVMVLLLQRADDTGHADRAWQRMGNWEPAYAPSVLSDQVDEALRLTREGADPVELCTYDEVEVKRAAQERAEKASFEEFKARYRRP